MANAPAQQLPPGETIVQITTNQDRLFVLTSEGRIFVLNRGAEPDGWREIPLPQAPAGAW